MSAHLKNVTEGTKRKMFPFSTVRSGVRTFWVCRGVCYDGVMR